MGALTMRRAPTGYLAVRHDRDCAIRSSYNGYAVAAAQNDPLRVTLAMMTVVSGSSVWLTNSLSISQLPESFGISSMRDRIPGFRYCVRRHRLSIVIAILMRSTWRDAGLAVGIKSGQPAWRASRSSGHFPAYCFPA